MEVYTEFAVVQMYICPLLVSYVADIIRTWKKATFSEMKKHTLCTQFSPLHAENCILGQISKGSMPPDPPWGMELTTPCWYSRVLYSNLMATSIIIETPEK